MSVPGSNLLLAALQLIRPQTVLYYRNTGRTTRPTGLDVATFAPAQPITQCSVQAVPLNRYESMGLDYKRRYVTLFAPKNVIGVERERSGDEFEYAGKRYSVIEGEADWFMQDGWTAVVGIFIIPFVHVEP